MGREETPFDQQIIALMVWGVGLTSAGRAEDTRAQI